jgi:hypothetical protein
MRYRVPRMGDTDVEFDGELLAERDTKDKPGNADERYPNDPSRWMEIRIYRLDDNKGWVTSVIGKSIRRGEKDRPRLWVCQTPDQVRDSLKRQPQGYLTHTALEALTDAAAKDERLKSSLVEQI